MPGSTEKATIKSQFYKFAHLAFLDFLRLVDGTHVRIQKPSENETDYENRHFYHSITVQGICHLMVDFPTRFPGSVHYSRI